MAIGRLSMKIGRTGKAGPHAAYIVRAGQYASRLEQGEVLEATGVGNMPAWAANPLAFWQAADAYERSNGTTYREMEIALPRELTPDQRGELIREFVRQELGARHAYQWAIHVPKAADGQEQPHAHLMFSERQVDGLARDPEQYFRRYNARDPEKGGARKGYGPHAGQTLAVAERSADLKALRGRWAVMANHHLARAGVAARIDLRSHAERGTGLAPEAKQLPSQWRGAGRETVLAYRAAQAELEQATGQVREVVPDPGGAILRQMAERVAERARRMSGAQPGPVAGQLHETWQAVPQAQRLAAIDYAVRSLPENQRRSAAAMLDQAPLGAAVMLPAVQWYQAMEKERESHLAGQVSAAEKVAADHRNTALNPHLAREPRLFGKARWQKTRDALMATDRENMARHARMKAGRFTPEERALADQEAGRRAGEKQPTLAGLGWSAQQQIREAVARGHAVESARPPAEPGPQIGRDQDPDYGEPEL